MTKAELADRVVDATGMAKKDAAQTVDAVFELIKATLAAGDSIKLSGFGGFAVRAKADRRGRNPQTGEAITITPRRVVTFKPSQLLKQAINGEG